MTKVPVTVQVDRWRAGYIEVVPKVPVYSRELNGYLGSVSLSPDDDYSIFPQVALEMLVDFGETFDCTLDISVLGDPLTTYVAE